MRLQDLNLPNRGEPWDSSTIHYSSKVKHCRACRKLGNISDACRNLGVSRPHYYDIKVAIQEDGLEGVLETPRKRPRIGNQVSPEIEQKILDYSLEYLA
jgi:hypothetical protein